MASEFVEICELEDFEPRKFLYISEPSDRSNTVSNRDSRSKSESSKRSSFDTVDSFERHLRRDCPEIVDELLRLENELLVRSRSKTEEHLQDDLLAITARREKLKQTLTDKKKEPLDELLLTKNVLTLATEQKYRGPLGMLCSVVQKRQRIRIWIRHRSGIRSILTCYLAAFDKHWNLAVEDVDELYFKPKSVRVFRASQLLAGHRQLPSSEGGTDSVDAFPPSSLVYTSAGGNHGRIEPMKRHISQLLIRGDHVVIIAISE